MGTLEQQVAELADREAIRDLPKRYCDCVWRDDIEGITNLFTEGGCFIAEMGGKVHTFEGRERLHAMFTGGLGIQPRPYIHNHVIELTGKDTARGRCYLDLHSARNDMAFIGAGYYEDEYRRTDAGWRFERRRFIALRMDDIPANLE